MHLPWVLSDICSTGSRQCCFIRHILILFGECPFTRPLRGLFVHLFAAVAYTWCVNNALWASNCTHPPRPRGHISKQYFMCRLSSLSGRRTEVGGRQSWLLRFHKHIHTFLSRIQGIFFFFFLHSSSLPTAVTSELVNFPVTLLGDVRKEYLMPKICVAKEYLWLGDGEGCWRGGSRWEMTE